MTRVIEEVIHYRDDRLRSKFIELGTPMEEMWELVTRPVLPNTDTLAGFTELKHLLTPDIFGDEDSYWACRVLDNAYSQTRLFITPEGYIAQENPMAEPEGM